MIYALIVFVILLLFIAVRNILRIGFRSYCIYVLIGLDQFANAFLGGMPDETISSRCARGQRYWYWRMLGRFLNWIDKDHLINALNSEKERLHQPEVLR